LIGDAHGRLINAHFQTNCGSRQSPLECYAEFNIPLDGYRNHVRLAPRQKIDYTIHALEQADALTEPPHPEKVTFVAPGRPFSAPLDSRGERVTAAACRGSIGVPDDKLSAMKVLSIVHFGTREILIAHRVHNQRDAAVLHNRVILSDIFVEGESVRKPRASAARYEYTQLKGVVRLPLDQIANLAGSAIREVDIRHHYSHVDQLTFIKGTIIRRVGTSVNRR
jgi:hypothetical protein